MAFKGNEYFWKDRKRYLGLPLSFTRYALSDDRLFLSVGFFSVKDDDILLYRVRDISVRRTLWQRLFGVGTITIQSSDKTHPSLERKSIIVPLRVKELLHDLLVKEDDLVVLHTLPSLTLGEDYENIRSLTAFLNEDGTVTYQKVVLGRRMGAEYEVLEGIADGAKVVTGGQIRLKDGIKVTVNE